MDYARLVLPGAHGVVLQGVEALAGGLEVGLQDLARGGREQALQVFGGEAEGQGRVQVHARHVQGRGVAGPGPAVGDVLVVDHQREGAGEVLEVALDGAAVDFEALVPEGGLERGAGDLAGGAREQAQHLPLADQGLGHGEPRWSGPVGFILPDDA